MKDALKNKPEAVVNKIMDGKMAGYYGDKVLYDMEYLLNSDEDMTVETLYRWGSL